MNSLLCIPTFLSGDQHLLEHTKIVYQGIHIPPFLYYYYSCYDDKKAELLRSSRESVKGHKSRREEFKKEDVKKVLKKKETEKKERNAKHSEKR